MDDRERKELIRLCHRYAANMKLAEPPQNTGEDLRDWFANARTLPASDRDADDAWFEVYDLVREAPDEAWTIIRDLLRETQDEGEAGAIGAGILESFVRHHGSGWVDEIEKEILSNHSFMFAMQNVNGIYRHPELDDRISPLLAR